MSYTVLALKWRPRRFEQLVGQTHVVQALVNSLAAERLHHAYLFAGTRGVGKTTLARILAKALNCAKGVVPEPCGECDACVGIDEGRFVDLIEVDAASRTGVDDTRELLDNVQYMPTRGRFKVYLIDEVHMLSNHSFNALLKTLEEPPPHVKFLFATTDPQKLPVTVLSRCLQFNLKKLTLAQIQEQLKKICAEEGVAADERGLKILAKSADGSMRDALSLLDQSIAFGDGEIKLEEVAAMLGTIDRGHVMRLIEALAREDGAALIAEVDQLDRQAPNYGAVLDELMGALQQIAVIQLVVGRELDEDSKALAGMAEQLSPEDVQLYYQIALNGRKDLAVCRDERMSFEMTLLRMLAFRPPSEPESEPVGTAKTRATTPPARTPKAVQSKPSPPATSDDNGAIEDWRELIQAAELRGAARQLADNCELRSSTAARLNLVLASDKSEFNTEKLRARLEGALSGHLGRELKITITPGTPEHPTPAEERIAGENERMRAARESIESDPTIKAVQSAFDAVLEADSIQPTDN